MSFKNSENEGFRKNGERRKRCLQETGSLSANILILDEQGNSPDACFTMV